MRSAPPAFALVTFAASLALTALTGCPMPDSSATRMQAAASDFNTDVRFGRLSLAVDKVDPKEREEFLAQRKKWNGHVEIADYELDQREDDRRRRRRGRREIRLVRARGRRPAHLEDSAEVAQHKGTWLLEKEALDDGAPGLLGETVAERTTAHAEERAVPDRFGSATKKRVPGGSSARRLRRGARFLLARGALRRRRRGAAFLVTTRRFATRSFFFTCALRRFIFIELRRSNLPIFAAPSGARPPGGAATALLLRRTRTLPKAAECRQGLVVRKRRIRISPSTRRPLPRVLALPAGTCC